MGGRLVRTTDKVSLTIQVAQNLALLIQHEQIGGVSREFTDNRPWPLPRRDRQAYDPILVQLTDVVQPGSLKLGAYKLAKGRRTEGVAHGVDQQMQTGSLGFTGHQQPMSFAWHADFEQQDAVAGLVDFLNSPVEEHRGNLP